MSAASRTGEQPAIELLLWEPTLSLDGAGAAGDDKDSRKQHDWGGGVHVRTGGRGNPQQGPGSTRRHRDWHWKPARRVALPYIERRDIHAAGEQVRTRDPVATCAGVATGGIRRAGVSGDGGGGRRHERMDGARSAVLAGGGRGGRVTGRVRTEWVAQWEPTAVLDCYSLKTRDC